MLQWGDVITVGLVSDNFNLVILYC